MYHKDLEKYIINIEITRTSKNFIPSLTPYLNPKTAGGGGQFDSPCGFSKNLSSKERVKPWCFVTFNVILRHIFPENFIEFPQVVPKI